MKTLLKIVLVVVIMFLLAFVPEIMKLHGVSSCNVENCNYFVGLITGCIGMNVFGRYKEWPI